MSWRLDFSIGPVQGFIAQARRTRDLWSGSYLLSYLSACALHAALTQQGSGAKVKVVPQTLLKDPVYRFVSGQSQQIPRTGSFPNHFTLYCDDPGLARQLAKAAQEAFEEKWSTIATTVWNKAFGPGPCEVYGYGTRQIWDRQVSQFWEVQWVIGPASDGQLLDARKRWRTHWLPEEPGDKCSVMPQFQELSGWVRARKVDFSPTGQRERELQQEFWTCLRKRVGELNLRENERLCAIALIKRVFPQIAQEVLGQDPDTRHWPSVVYIAAVPWLRKALSSEEARKLAKRYASELRKLAPEQAFSEYEPDFEDLDKEAADGFACLNPHYLRRVAIRNPSMTPFDPDRLKQACQVRATTENKIRSDLASTLQKLAEIEIDGQKLGEPPSYYAVVQADGDRLGKILAQRSEHERDQISEALHAFAQEAHTIARSYDACVVYAGGDDVLAFAPVETALDYAWKLRQAYEESIKERAGSQLAKELTLSAGVVFAHIHAPLTRVLQEAREVLDVYAKERNDRNSLAISVYHRGGRKLLWRSTWRRNSGPVTEELTALRERLRTEGGELSTSGLHNLFELLVRLFHPEGWRPGAVAAPTLKAEEVSKLVSSELTRGLERKHGNTDVARKLAHQLGDQLAALLEERCNPARSPNSQPGYLLDVLPLLLFLAKGGQEEEHA